MTTDTPADSGLAGSLAAFMRIEKIISDNLYHQWEKVEDARLIAREQIGILSALTPATTDHDALIEKLERAAVTASETQRSMAEAKSLRQEGNAERRTDLYMWPTPEQTLEGKAAAAIRHLSAAEQAAAERERELVEQIKADRDTFRDCDILDDPIGAAAQLEAAMRNCDALLAKYGDE